jgi:hypothetical protein
MKNILNIYFIFLGIFLIGCDSISQKPISNKNELILTGYYRYSGWSATGAIMCIKDSLNIDYLQYSDIGGIYFGNIGRYEIIDDTLLLQIFYPVNEDTHLVKFDTLEIKKWNNTYLFLPKYVGNDWDVVLDKNNNSIKFGSSCFAKVAELNDDYYRNIEIWEWNRVTNKNSIPVKFPPVPPFPRIEDVKNIKFEEIEVEN